MQTAPVALLRFAFALPVLLLCAFAAGAGCGHPEPAQGIAHLDPRLADGRSSAEVLAQARRELERWEAGATGIDGWTSTAPGALERMVGLAPLSCNALELRLRASAAGTVTLHWRRKDGGESAASQAAWPAAHSLRREFAESSQVQTIVFDLALHPRWNGAIDALRLEFGPESAPQPALEAIALVERGWPAAPLRGADLVPLELDARRAWPAAFGQELVARCTVPPRGRLCLDTATLPALRGVVERVHFEVELNSGDGQWTRIGLRKIFPREKPGEALWRPWTIDLAPWSGTAVELRLRARDASPQAGASDPAANAAGTAGARVLWGAPIVLGEPDAELLPNLVLVTLGSTRADHLGERTPYLLELGRGGIECARAYASSDETQAAHRAILGGPNTANPSVPALAEHLRARGYFTVAAISESELASSGCEAGFDVVVEPTALAPTDGSSTVFRTRQLFDLWNQEQGARPFFLWLQIADPREPHAPPAEYARGWSERWKAPRPEMGEAEQMRWAYAVEVSHADALVENLASHLAELKWLGRTGWVITADHGTWLREGEGMEELARVPLIMNLPGGPKGERIENAVSGEDIAPTVCAWLGIDVESGKGIDLLQLLEGGKVARRELWFETGDGKRVEVGR